MKTTITDRRKALKMTQQQLAEKSKLTRHRASEIETGRFHPHPQEAEALAEALECSPHDLAFRPQAPHKPTSPEARKKLKRFRHKASYRPPRQRTGESRVGAARNYYSNNRRGLEPLLARPAIRQFVDDAPFDSTMEFVYWMERINREQARPAEVAPLFTGFDLHSVVCAQTKRVVGHCPVPALVTDRWVAILQVSVLTPTLYTMDALVCVIHDGKRYHFAVELEGPGKAPPDSRRDRALGIPILRFTTEEVLAGVGINDKLNHYFRG